MEHYGKELILDLKGCCSDRMDRSGILTFFDDLINILKMEKQDVYLWGPEGLTPEQQSDPRLFGVSGIQFITTSNITIHTLPFRNEVYLNIFSCNEFDSDDARKFCEKYWGATHSVATTVDRG